MEPLGRSLVDILVHLGVVFAQPKGYFLQVNVPILGSVQDEFSDVIHTVFIRILRFRRPIGFDRLHDRVFPIIRVA